MFPDQEKSGTSGSWVLRSTCLSKKTEEHFQFFVHTLRENLMESFCHLTHAIISYCTSLYGLMRSNFPLLLRTFEEDLKKVNSGSGKHWTLFPSLNAYGGWCRLSKLNISIFRFHRRLSLNYCYTDHFSGEYTVFDMLRWILKPSIYNILIGIVDSSTTFKLTTKR